MGRVITWNIKHGGGQRVDRILASVLAHEPQTVVLTEFRENDNGRRIREALAKAGLAHQSSAGSEPQKNAVLVCATESFTEERPLREMSGCEHRCVQASFADLDVHGLYFPLNDTKNPLFDKLIASSPAMLKRRSLLIGDFNTGLHAIDEVGATFHHAKKLEQLLEAGWVDCWRRRNPVTREYSWFSSHGNGFRIDHAFASPELHDRVSADCYSHGERESSESDHSILVVEIAR
jgi:exodeoxyribonuclease-3